MKRVILNVLAVVLMVVSCSACSGASSGKIIMTTIADEEFSFSIRGSGVATVDLGNGSEKVPMTLDESGVGLTLKPKDPQAPKLTITITGGSITGLVCKGLTILDVSRCTELEKIKCEYSKLKCLDVSKNIALKRLECEQCQLTSLDMSKNAALEVLLCSRNGLTSLAVSEKNTALEYIDCDWNELTSSALNALFGMLPRVENGTISIIANPGADDCGRSIAEGKKWTVKVSNF